MRFELESLELQDRYNNFRRLVCKVAEDVLGRKYRKSIQNISKKIFRLAKDRTVLYKKFLSGKSYENKNVEKALENELRKCNRTF